MWGCGFSNILILVVTGFFMTSMNANDVKTLAIAGTAGMLFRCFSSTGLLLSWGSCWKASA